MLRSSAASTAEYLAISAERLRRLRLAWRIGWLVLAGEVVVFVIWIWDHLYSGARPHDAGAERFAWGWLAGFTLVAIVAAGVVRPMDHPRRASASRPCGENWSKPAGL